MLPRYRCIDPLHLVFATSARHSYGLKNRRPRTASFICVSPSSIIFPFMPSLTFSSNVSSRKTRKCRQLLHTVSYSGVDDCDRRHYREPPPPPRSGPGGRNDRQDSTDRPPGTYFSMDAPPLSPLLSFSALVLVCGV